MQCRTTRLLRFERYGRVVKWFSTLAPEQKAVVRFPASRFFPPLSHTHRVDSVQIVEPSQESHRSTAEDPPVSYRAVIRSADASSPEEMDQTLWTKLSYPHQ